MSGDPEEEQRNVASPRAPSDNLRNRPQDWMRTAIADALFAEAAKARARIDRWTAMGSKAEIALAKLEAEEEAFMRAGQMASLGVRDVVDAEADVTDHLLEAAEYAKRVLVHLFEQTESGEDLAVLGDLDAAIAKARGGK